MDDISNCIICGDWNIEKKDFFLSENLIYVPFFKTRDEVLSLYKKKVLLNPLIPIAFKRKRALNSIQKVYLPGLLTNINQSGDVEFLARDKRVYKENKRNFCTGPDCYLIDDFTPNITGWEKRGGTGILFRSAKGFAMIAAQINAKGGSPALHGGAAPELGPQRPFCICYWPRAAFQAVLKISSISVAPAARAASITLS